MNKQKIVEQIISQLEQDRKALMDAALATYQAATNEESKPENEYDTRGLEASYLAGAQAKRVSEIDEQLFIFKSLKIKDFTENSPIGICALIKLNSDGKIIYLLMMPKAGGLSIHFEGQAIQIVTASSPLGEALMNLKKGDTAIVETGKSVKEYEILSVN